VNWATFGCPSGCYENSAAKLEWPAKNLEEFSQANAGAAMRQDIELLTQTADFVVKYGFLAVGLVLIFVIAPAIYKLANATRLAYATATFGVAFVIVYGILGVVTAVAPQWISGRRALVSGVVLGVPNGQHLQMKSDLRLAGFAYTKREHDAQQTNVFNFPFLLVTSASPSCLAVGLESTGQNSNSAEAYFFNIAPLAASVMAANVEIVVQVSEDKGKPALKVSRETNGKPGKTLVFRPLADNDLGCETPTESTKSWSIFSSAYAQSKPSETQYQQKLQSDDVFTRRNARIGLSKETENFDLIGSLLARDDNYRIQLGALTALASMPEEQRRRGPDSLLKKVRALRDSKDKTMRDTAVQALNEPAMCYQERDANKPLAERFLVLCHWSKEQCERTRGPNTRPGISQSPCAPVQLSRASWAYTTGGYDGAWYQHSPTALGPPFPQVPQ
jgi:hypothetical protein